MSTTQPPASPARSRATMIRPAAARPLTARLSAGGPAPGRPSDTDVRCEALFASGLQASGTLAPDAVTQAITHTLRRLGRRGCAGLMAQEFGDHPEVAGERMRWARRVVTGIAPASLSPRTPLPC